MLKERTLTKLYNERPAWLANLHAALDRAVWAAYGWEGEPAEATDEETLAKLLALNRERGAATDGSPGAPDSKLQPPSTHHRLGAAGEEAMNARRTVLFLCPHNAAKSVLAAAEFDRLTAERGLPLVAGTAGTDPAAGPSPAVVAALASEGIDVSGHRPRRVTAADLASAVRIVSLGCDPAALGGAGDRLERWDDVPAAGNDPGTARDAIRRRVAVLVDELAEQGA